MTALNLIYVSADQGCVGSSAELRCQDHPDWWADADGTNLPDVLKAAVDHLREDHREHVAGCACRDRVVDQRCYPPIGLMEMAR